MKKLILSTVIAFITGTLPFSGMAMNDPFSAISEEYGKITFIKIAAPLVILVFISILLMLHSQTC